LCFGFWVLTSKTAAKAITTANTAAIESSVRSGTPVERVSGGSCVGGAVWDVSSFGCPLPVGFGVGVDTGTAFA
jgi:hypothetical protein